MKNKKSFLLFILMASVFVGGLDMGIVAPAFSALTRDFATEPRWTVWALTLYAIVYATAMPLVGKLTDRVGRKKMLMACLSLFGVGSALCALAPDLHTFLLGRAIQAIGGGGIFPVANAMIGDVFPAEKRGKALGMVGAMMGLALVIGPNIGGWLVQYLSWRWIFWVNVPMVLLILVFLLRLVDEYQPRQSQVDYLGALLLLVFMMFLLAGISFTNNLNIPGTTYTVHTLVYFSIAAVAIFLFFWQERRAPDPVVDFKLLFNPQIFFTYLIAITTGYVMTAAFFIPAYTEVLLNLPPSLAGAMITPLALGILFGTPLSGVLLDRMAAKHVILAGATVGFVGILFLLYSSAMLTIIFSLLVAGFGLGFLMGAPLNYLIINSVDPHHRGSALGILSVFRLIGISVGSTMAGILIHHPFLDETVVAAGYKDIYWYLLYVIALAFVLALFLRRNIPGREKA